MVRRNFVRASDITEAIMAASERVLYRRVLDRGRVKEWIGNQWVDRGEPKSPEHRMKLPLVVHD